MERSPADQHGGMTSTSNKQIVDAFIAALFTNGDLTAVDRYLDPAFVDHDRSAQGLPHWRAVLRHEARGN